MPVRRSSRRREPHRAPTRRRSSVLDVDSYVHANSINLMIVIAIGAALRGIASSVSVWVVTLHWSSEGRATRAVTRWRRQPLADRFPSEHDQAHPLQGSEISLQIAIDDNQIGVITLPEQPLPMLQPTNTCRFRSGRGDSFPR